MAKAKSTTADSFGSPKTGISAVADPTRPKPGALLIAEAKTFVVSATKDGKLKIGCNSFKEPVVIVAAEHAELRNYGGQHVQLINKSLLPVEMRDPVVSHFVEEMGLTLPAS